MGTRQDTVTTTAAKLVTFNPKRTSLFIQNLGINPVFLSENLDNVTTKGIQLLQNDALTEIMAMGGTPELDFFAQSTGGSSLVAIKETFGKIPSDLVSPAYTKGGV